MILNISNHNATVIERGVYYYAPADYPHISALGLKNLVAFAEYEKLHGRKTEIVCENAALFNEVSYAITHPESVADTLVPEKIIGCTACKHGGCLTEFVYHATSLNATKQILSSGKLLSAARAYGKTGDELAFEKRDSLWNDPADFFEYIMFCWGNCMVGDYVVMSEGTDKSFRPGVRFYFRYDDLIRHPGHAFDGYHPIKVKDEIVLTDYLHACVIPEKHKDKMEGFVPAELAEKVHFVPQNELEILDWTENIYDLISNIRI